MVKGVTHRWKYTVFFRPSITDIDFPPSWTSEVLTNSETVLTATIPAKVAVFTVSADGLDMNRVSAALVKVRYKASLAHRDGRDALTIKSTKVRPGGPDKYLYFYDDEPKVNLPCEYQYTLLYADKPPYTSEWLQDQGGIIIPFDLTYYGTPTESGTGIIDATF